MLNKKFPKTHNSHFSFTMDSTPLANYTLEQGGVYNLLVARDPETNKMAARLYTLTSPNSIHILWQFPQYFVITSSEVMFSVTGERKSIIYEKENTFSHQDWSSPTARPRPV